MYRCAKFTSLSLSFAAFTTDGLATTLPHGAPSSKDALCTWTVGVAQPPALGTSHAQQKLFDAHCRRSILSSSEEAISAPSGRNDIELSQSTVSVERDRAVLLRPCAEVLCGRHGRC